MTTTTARHRGQRQDRHPRFNPLVLTTAILFLASFALVIWVNFDPRMTIWTRLATAALTLLLALAHSIALEDAENRRKQPPRLEVIPGGADSDQGPEEAA